MLGESVYQPGAGERAALSAAGYAGFPARGESAANTPFPLWRCIANVLLNDEPNEKCNGLVNRTQTRQHNHGVAGQLSGQATIGGVEHRWLVGAGSDASRVRFGQSTQFGYIKPDRSVTPVAGPGAFADGTQSSENAWDARVELSSRSRTASVYASDTIALTPQTHLTLSGRDNRSSVSNVDGITPGGGPGSLDGSHRFSRFNPAIGMTFAPSESLTLYAGANQGSPRTDRHRARLRRSLKLFLQVNNLLDRKYTTGGQLGANAFDARGNFVARALPRNAGGEFPVPRASFFAPGTPRTVWVGLRYTFGS